jgi:type I restriction enzyme S subunit
MIETKFKQGELCAIPTDWAEGRFCDFLQTFSSGATPYRGNPRNYIGSIPWISSGELNYNVITDTLEHISENAQKQTNLKLHKPGTFLMAITGLEAAGTRGKCAFVGVPATTNQSCMAINGTDKMDTSYLYWFYRFWSETLAFKFCQGTKQQSYTAAIVKSLPIYTPDNIVEQQRIASALTSVDNLLSSLDKLIAKKRDIKQGAMQQLLTGKTRLKGFTEPWCTKILGEYSKIYRGGSPRPIEAYLTDSADGVNWIKIGDVKAGSKYINKTNERIKPSGVPMSRKVYVGDFILSNSMSFGRPYILNIDGCIHDGWLVIQDYQETFDKDFLYYALGSDDVFKQYISMAAGSSVKNLNKDKVANVVLSVPNTKSEQQAIASVLSSMDTEIVALEAKRKKYEAVKQGMMQQLLTGKIRLI